MDNLSEVPVVALALGPCAGLGAGRVGASHYSVMVKELSQVFVAGPPVARAIGEEVTKEELGGWQIQARNGTVDEAVETEAEAFQKTRDFLSFLPSSVHERPARTEPTDAPDRREESLIDIVPTDGKTPYKPRRIVEACVDAGSFFEIDLSERRAVAVQTYLSNQGVRPIRMAAYGRGESQPLPGIPGSSAENRRVEIVLTPITEGQVS